VVRRAGVRGAGGAPGPHARLRRGVCVRVRVFSWAARLWRHERTCARIRTQTRTHTFTRHTPTHAHAHAHTCARAGRTCAHAHAHTCARAGRRTCRRPGRFSRLAGRGWSRDRCWGTCGQRMTGDVQVRCAVIYVEATAGGPEEADRAGSRAMVALCATLLFWQVSFLSVSLFVSLSHSVSVSVSRSLSLSLCPTAPSPAPSLPLPTSVCASPISCQSAPTQPTPPHTCSPTPIPT
jgi:hypothetical protein